MSQAMRIPLLGIKLNIPPLKKTLVRRHHLFEILDSNLTQEPGFTRKLTLVSAPAGYGKTTLVSDWIRKNRLNAVWISLDDDDNDIFRFLMYLITALQQVDSQVDDSCLSLFNAPQPPSVEAVSTILLNQIEPIPVEFVIVLDDYHVIEEPMIHQLIDFTLTYQPPQMHLALVSRADPPIHLARLRGQGQITELRMHDLRFTQQEADQFIHQIIGERISENDLARLVSRTEGWATGILMAAMSMQGRKDISAFIHSFSGSHRYILDYLFEEVLQRQPLDVRSFLLQTSILERLCSSLCDHVTGRDDGAQILDYLDKANLFVIPLDDERNWYRYHKLFSDLLRGRLEGSDPSQIPELHNRASQWYERQGHIMPAVDHALNAQQYDKALTLIEEVAGKILMRTQVSTLLRWQGKIPKSLLSDRPNLSFLLIWAQMLKGYQFSQILEQVEKLEVDGEWLPGRKSTLIAFIEISQANLEAAGDHAQEALDKLRDDDIYFRSIALWILGVSQAIEENLVDSCKVMTQLLEVSKSHDNTMFSVMTATYLARLQIHLGNLSKAEAVYTNALEIGRDRRGNLLPISGEALIGLGELYRELNELDKATDALLEGIELNLQWRDATAIDGYIALARVKQAQGDFKTAQDAIDKAMALAIKYDAVDIDDRMVMMYQTRLWLAAGNLDSAGDWAATLSLEKPGDLEAKYHQDFINYHCKIREAIVLTRFYICQQQYTHALPWIHWLLAFFEEMGRLDSIVEILILKAEAYQGLGDQKRSLDALTKALEIGEATGFIRLFLDEGKPMKTLLTRARLQKIYPAYVDHLLSAFDSPPKAPRLQLQPLVDPLSEREQDVLKLLRTNLTTPEIAEELYISVTTVRTHIKKIYSKLNVHKRSEAVYRAEELGLV
jgi:LuxR family maltose regulon positive regulatory protein